MHEEDGKGLVGSPNAVRTCIHLAAEISTGDGAEDHQRATYATCTAHMNW